MKLLAAGAIEGAVIGSGTAVFALLVVAAVGAALRGRASVSAAGSLMMAYSWGYRGMAVVTLLMGVGLLGVAAASAAGSLDLGDAKWIPFGFGGFFTLGGAVMTVEGFRRLVVVAEDGVAGRGWFGDTGVVGWEEVARVRYSNGLSAFVVEAGGRRVVVPQMLGGQDAFRKTCRRRLDKAVYGKVFKEHGHKPLG